ncbi:MAG: hypothetical protein IJV40_03585 [Oscillospiraceae bacterium]|nr:hypothetical protein [Oscillospiraceae bacterium]
MARDTELWSRIRADFLATGASYKSLAEKYGVSLSKVKRIAAKELWTSGGTDYTSLAEEAKFVSKKRTKTNQSEPSEPKRTEPDEPESTALIVPEAEDTVITPRDRYERFMEITDSMMDRIADALASPDVINPYSLKLLASALRDIREMQGLNKSELDREEQKARIAKLKKEAEDQMRLDEVFTVEFVDTEGAEI